MGKFKLFRSQSLLTRTIILIVAAVVISNVIGWGLYQKDRHKSEWDSSIERVSERLTSPVIAIAENPDLGEVNLSRSFGFRGQFVWVSKEAFEDDLIPFPLSSSLNDAVEKELDGSKVTTFSLMFVDEDDVEEVKGFEQFEDRMKHRRKGKRWGHDDKEWKRHWKKPDDFIVLSAQVETDRWVNVAVPFHPFSFGWRPQIPGGFIFSLIIVIFITVWAMRKATRPLTVFAKAAERLGR
ncbi:MAG: hypothetical protein OQK35_00740, partial [Alphaproteobacteria bacterium]|nr:hypothetical protein [Alphaproteobacteria bacterium]